MKILSLSLDSSALNRQSALAERLIEYGNLVQGYFLVVPSEADAVVRLSEKVIVQGVGGGNKASKIIKLFLASRRIIKKEKISLVSVQDAYYLGLVAWLLARYCGIGLEIQIHGFERFSGLRKQIAKLIIKRSGSVRAVSQRLKKKLIGEFGVNDEKITVASVFYEQRTRAIIKRKKNEKIIFFSAGRLVPVKNFPLQIYSILKLKKQGIKSELWIAGDGPEEDKLVKLIGNNNLETDIKLLGWRSDIRSLFEQADIYLLSSDSEGWGLSVIEAAAAGLPVIMTDVGCAGEVIKNRESGIVVPVGNVGLFAEAMQELAIDDVMRMKLGEAAKSAADRLPGKNDIFKLLVQSWARAEKTKRT